MHTPSPRRTAATPADPGGREPVRRVVGHIRGILRVMKEHAKQVEARAGLARAQVWTLEVIASAGEIAVGELAQTMGLHQSTTSNLVKPLLEKELLCARRIAQDRRALYLKLTAKGRRVLTRVPGPFRGVLADSLDQLDDAALRRLDRDLGRLLRVMGGAGDETR